MPAFDRPTAVSLIAATPVMGIFAWWMLDDGGYHAVDWMPGAIFVLLLLVVTASGARGLLRRPTAMVWIALGAFAAYTVWSFASVLWADAPGPALEGSQRTLLYLACFATFALLPWSPRLALHLASAFVLLVAGVGIITLVGATGAESASSFIDARLAAPLGYQNAAPALWTMAAFPAVMLASRQEIASWLRPPLLAASVLLIGLAVMSQSRGWLFTLPIVLLAAVVLCPGRWRLAAFAVPVAAAVAVIRGDLLNVFETGSGTSTGRATAPVAAAIDTAAQSLLGATLALAVIGTLLVVLERRLDGRLPDLSRYRRTAGVVVVSLAAVGAVASGLVASDGDPAGRIESAWSDFTHPDELVVGNRFRSLETTRYDYWRVSLNVWRAHPVAGVGQDNFAEAYLKARRVVAEEPRWVHSLPLRLLTHTGLVGAIVFLVFLVAGIRAAIRGWRSCGDGAHRAAVGALLVPAVVWLAHGSVDWLWEYPALSATSLALAGAALATGSGLSRTRDERASLRRAHVVALSAGAAVGIVTIVPCYIADRDIDTAARTWPRDPAAALARLDRAQALNPLNVRSSLVEGIIAVRLERLDRAQRAFRRAARREPQNWFARFQLGLVASARGRSDEAARDYRAAQALNPRDRLLAQAVRRAGGPSPLTFTQADEELARRVRIRVRPF